MTSDLPGGAKVRPLGALVSKLRQFGPGDAKAVLIGVDGCGGSGKSTLARLLAAALPDACIVETDDFYRPGRDRQKSGDEIGSHFDWKRLERQVLRPLSEGRDGRFQLYDWGNDELAGWRDVPDRGIVLVEGVYSTRRELSGYYDFRIWIEASHETRLARGLARDGDGARDRWVKDWMPAEDRYVSAHAPARTADVVVIGDRLPSVDPTRQFVELTGRAGRDRNPA